MTPTPEPDRTDRQRHVVVVGAGISGLAAAYFLATGPGRPG